MDLLNIGTQEGIIAIAIVTAVLGLALRTAVVLYKGNF